ncbi:amino acid/polyamine transporter I [Naematelia encephala]|uniref:Amino acid/polyamine transporter I n=1 Tax=Naematelia encephala TaxID=71784 RepID=A0A1Y2B618_9TREE|nr:amino acid/polyamine transporter I [Naematelia encephala]
MSQELPSKGYVAGGSQSPAVDTDAEALAGLGYVPVLKRSFGLIESFASSFCAMNFIGVTRVLLYIGLATGGSAAIWSSSVVSIVGVTITAAVLAEICSALPISGSIYVWASEAAGKRAGRLVGFVVGWWAATAWVSFVASNSQAPAQFLLSLMVVFDKEFPGGLDASNVTYRGALFGVSFGCMWIALLLNYLPPKWFARTFRFTVYLLLLDLVLSLIWLPIGVSRTYGFRTAKEVFTGRNNGTGFGEAWNWALSFYYAGYVACGYDAAGHIAEETKNASLTAARGIFWSAFAAAVCSLIATTLWLFCIPPDELLYSFDAPQPFVQIWQASIGKGGAVVMTIIAVLGLILSTSCAVTASSRLIFAIARDGILPGSKWISTPNSAGQPKNAITLIAVLSTVLLIISIGSQVAFTSLLSAGAVTSISAYALISFCRLLVTPHEFKHTRWSLGKWGPFFYAFAFAYNTFLLTVLYSPLEYPFTAATFNFAIVIIGAVSIFGILSWWFIPADKWLRPELIASMRSHAVQDGDEAGIYIGSEGERKSDTAAY